MTPIRIDVPGRTFAANLPASRVRVGSGAGCDLRLGGAGVATEHFDLEPLPDGRWRLRDLQSGRPTKVNGVDARQVSLRPGDVIEVGDARIHFDPSGTPTAAAPREVAAPSPARPAASTRPATATPEGPSRVAARESAKRLRLGLALVGSGGLLAIVLALALGGSSGEGGGRAARDVERAERLHDAGDVEGATAIFARVAADPAAGDARLTAERWLDRLRKAGAEAQADLDALARDWQTVDLAGAALQREILVRRHGPSFGARFDEAVAAARTRQDAWAQEVVSVARDAATGHLGGKRFGDALAVWQALRARSGRADVRAAASEGVAAVEAAAKEAAGAVLAEADAAASPADAVALLDARAGAFAGTAAHALLASRRAEIEARRAAPANPTLAVPGAAPPVAAADAAAVDEARATRAIGAADRAAGERRLAEAAEMLDAALAETTDAKARDRIAARRGDLSSARAGILALAGDVRKNPARYEGIPLTETFTVSLVEADEEGVTAAVAGGRAKHRWAALGADRVAAVVDRMQPGGTDAVALAAFLHEVGARDAWEALLVRASETGVDAAVVHPLVARWRREAPPAGGYVAHGTRFVSPAERDRLVLEARIAEQARQVDAKDPAARRKAVDELLALGEPAKAPLRAALMRRRGALASALAADKVLTSAKTRTRLFEELEKRRREAVSLVEDERRYPYPNPDHKGQDEVDARVARVRELWDRPFLVVASFDEGIRAGLALVTEVDEALARLDREYVPDLDALAEKASAAVDLRGFAPPGPAAAIREYSLQVLAYNEKVATTATPEERDNVRAVNEYRMMMGRRALKIHERLVRAARGHSRHMREHDYFAHDAPARFADVRTPALRARRQGYAGGVGENIAQGPSSGRDAFDAWYRSSGHHRNLLGAGYTDIGTGRSGGLWWTQLFGGASQLSLVPPEPLAAPAPDVAPEPEDPAAAGKASSPARLPDEPPPSEQPTDPPK
jgi:uncharacterized protein YkwD